MGYTVAVSPTETWDYILKADREQAAKDKDDDFPTLLKYLANSEPSFRFLKTGPQIFHRRKQKGNGRG